MRAIPIAIQAAGLVTSVGLTAAQCCAAFRAKLTNPTETRFIDSNGDRIMAHQVQMQWHLRGLTRLTKMAAMAIAEALDGLPKRNWAQLPLILCVAESDRPGRLTGLDDRLLVEIESELNVQFAATSGVVAQGRTSVAAALVHARTLISQARVPNVLIVATDSLLSWSTLGKYEQQDRLLTARNSNGFLPGEAAGSLLVGAPTGQKGELVCTGIGFGRETAHIYSDMPLRAEGLSAAIKGALGEAGCRMHDMDFRIVDNSGEQYYFKESSLALSRTLRARKEEFDMWHPAECTGEIGATTGVTIVATARAACDGNYGKGSNVLAHMSNDTGNRAALTLILRAKA